MGFLSISTRYITSGFHSVSLSLGDSHQKRCAMTWMPFKNLFVSLFRYWCERQIAGLLAQAQVCTKPLTSPLCTTISLMPRNCFLLWLRGEYQMTTNTYPLFFFFRVFGSLWFHAVLNTSFNMQDRAASLQTFDCKYLHGVYQLLLHFVHGQMRGPVTC